MSDNADWVSRQTGGKPVSTLGAAAADILARVYKGIYNAPINVDKVNWSDNYLIRVTVQGDLATFDADQLTGLVLLAHAACVRISVAPCNGQYLTLRFGRRRSRTGDINRRHPTIDTAIEHWAHGIAAVAPYAPTEEDAPHE